MTVVEFYRARSPREQLLLRSALLLLAALLAFLLLIAPLRTAYRQSLAEHLAAVDRNGRVKALAASADGRRPANIADLSLYLTDNARQKGMDVTASGNASEATVNVARAAPSSLLGWIQSLEEAGYTIDSVRIAPAGEGAVAGTFTVRVGP